VRLGGREHLDKLAKAHADVRGQIAAWVAEIEDAAWRTQQDVTARFPSASFLKERVAVFNIKGNKYRVEAQISFKIGVVRVLRAGTHAEYDEWTH